MVVVLESNGYGVTVAVVTTIILHEVLVVTPLLHDLLVLCGGWSVGASEGEQRHEGRRGGGVNDILQNETGSGAQSRNTELHFHGE